VFKTSQHIWGCTNCRISSCYFLYGGHDTQNVGAAQCMQCTLDTERNENDLKLQLKIFFSFFGSKWGLGFRIAEEAKGKITTTWPDLRDLSQGGPGQHISFSQIWVTRTVEDFSCLICLIGKRLGYFPCMPPITPGTSLFLWAVGPHKILGDLISHYKPTYFTWVYAPIFHHFKVPHVPI